MKFSLVAKWMLVIGGSAAVVAGSTALHYWNQRNELVHAEILRHFQEFAPDLRIVGNTRLNGLDGVTLRDVEIHDRETDQTLFRARSITVALDSQALLDGQKIVVQSVEVDSADVLVVREDDGRWNWQRYLVVRPEAAQTGVPRVDIRQLRVQLHLKHGDAIPSARLLLASPRLQAVPTSAHGYDLDAPVDLPGAGSLKLTGQYDVASGEWKMGGRLRNVAADQNLLRVAQNTHPQIRQQLTDVDLQLRQLLPPPRMVDSRSESALLIGSDISRAPRFRGRFDVDFDVSRASSEHEPLFRLMVAIHDGSVSVPGIPVKLSDVEAVFYRDNETVRLKIYRARQDDAEVAGDFSMAPGSNVPPVMSFDVKRFPFGPELRPLFPLRSQSLFDRFQPKLTVTGTGQLIQRSDGKWQLRDIIAKVENGQIVHHQFQYPLTGISADIRQRLLDDTDGEVVMDVRATGLVGARPWTARGWWKNPGPATESRFTADVADVPLDSRFRQALLPAGRIVFESLNLTGTVTGTLNSYRPPGLNQPTHTFIDANVINASLQFSGFPYPIDDLSGHVMFDSRQAHWTFENLQGRHDDARISGAGTFVGLPKPGVLDLTIQGRGVRLNADLYNALSSSHRELWDLMDADGQCDLTALIDWTAAPGERAIVRFPQTSPVRIYDATIRPRPFPYKMDVEEAIVSFDPDRGEGRGLSHCEIHSVQASHQGAPIAATGWAELHSDGQWQVHLDDLTAQRLPPDDDLRVALPDSWRETLARLLQQGRVSLEPSQIDFRGITNANLSVTAAWDMKLRLHDCGLNAGLNVDNVNGVVTSAGSWDGSQLRSRGDIRLDSADVMEMPLTRIMGPYTIENSEVVLGSREVLTARNSRRVDRDRRLRAQAYGGTLFLDTLINTRDRGSYFMFAELQKALLQSYAKRHLPNSGQLKGVVTAWLALQGDSDSAADVRGRGQMEISPAALYELPVVFEMLRSLSQPQLNFNVRDRTAFDYALMTFDVKDERIQFDQMDLVGESLSLRGRGSVGFAGDVALDFYSRPPRPRGPRLPVIDWLVNGATQWVRVKVRGTTKQPETEVRSAVKLDESLQQFLNAFNVAPGMMPGLIVPGAFPFAINPLTRGAGAFQQ